MFWIPRTNVIATNTFSVEVLGRTSLEYVEGEHVVKIDSEFALGNTGLIVFTGWMAAWDAPIPGEPIDQATNERITNNIRAAFKFRGFTIEVV